VSLEAACLHLLVEKRPTGICGFQEFVVRHSIALLSGYRLSVIAIIAEDEVLAIRVHVAIAAVEAHDLARLSHAEEELLEVVRLHVEELRHEGRLQRLLGLQKKVEDSRALLAPMHLGPTASQRQVSASKDIAVSIWGMSRPRP
jgi:hypothetical protein